MKKNQKEMDKEKQKFVRKMVKVKKDQIKRRDQEEEIEDFARFYDIKW